MFIKNLNWPKKNDGETVPLVEVLPKTGGLDLLERKNADTICEKYLKGSRQKFKVCTKVFLELSKNEVEGTVNKKVKPMVAALHLPLMSLFHTKLQFTCL